MRTYEQIIEEYVSWYYKKTEDSSFDPRVFFDETYPDKLSVRKATVWKTILELCYSKDNGIFWFWMFILGDMTYAGYPQPIKFNSLWLKWSKICRKGDHIGIKCSRQHGKSTYWTVIQSVYRTAMFENYNVLITSASEDQAIMMLGFIQKIVENNEFLASKKYKSAKWSTTEMAYNGGKIVGKGVGSEVRGGTYDYIICDDVLRSDNKLSDEDVEKFIDEELEPMILVRQGQIIIVGTPKSETDIFSTIEDRIDDGSLWQLHTYPAITSYKRKEILCPDRFTWLQLMKKKSIMGVMKFEKEFMCKTYSSGSQLFSDELRKIAMDRGVTFNLHPRARIEDLNIWSYYVGVDCARAGTAGGDYTVVTVIGYNPATQEKKICWIWREKGLKISEQVRHIAEISRNFNGPIILVEKNNIGQDFIDQLIDDYNLHIESFTTGVRSKEDLIRFLITSFEHEKMILPQGNDFSKEVIRELNKELGRFVVEITRAGNEVMKGSGHSHDDMVMSLALANKCSQHYGYVPFAVSEQKVEHESELGRYAGSDDMIEIVKF